MNRKAASGVIMENIIYLVALAVFVGLMIFYIGAQRDGAAVWSDIYAKEIVGVIDSGMAGQDVILDVQKPTSIAIGNGISLSAVFAFDNANNNLCVSLSRGKQSCYKYSNNVDIINVDIKKGVPENLLTFKIVEKKRNSEVKS